MSLERMDILFVFYYRFRSIMIPLHEIKSLANLGFEFFAVNGNKISN
ncbi:hypothetical protein LEP1GSC199_2627 [Leptospira vanthielii serovar Holland str. Waz Holland = ATCC 700522]|uniref:Uncharacterized protein n=1 Tax=Leptospira vanthielii serovar Holland str. Waz Holland = ATCC 700522 TaxID=1218591 RepID=N1W9I2_9LEPT|nr:hypothetical protein LEP1GSC199_2627 [Leptospira vanthielii serovar Holland str. Waz Holland = ATCC 700522]